MNIKLLNEAINELKEDLGDGLVSTDIFMAADAQSIAGYNSQPKASALFTQVLQTMNKALRGSGFPGVGRYFSIDLVDGLMVFVIPLDTYIWGMTIDTKKVQMGLVINVTLPKVLDTFEHAIAA